ncbi:MAG: rod-binding protein [Pseudomonadota bacterium]
MMDDLLTAQLNTAVSSARADAPRSTRAQTPEQARAIAEEFEAVFLAQMMEHMMGPSTKSETFGGGAGESAFTGMLNEEYAKVLSKSGGIGLADALTREILRLQDISEG